VAAGPGKHVAAGPGKHVAAGPGKRAAAGGQARGMMVPSGTVTRGSALIRSARIGLLVLCGGVLLWHSLQYDFVTDDAYISFVFARNLAEHGALVFNPGMDPVEGYTNFLWTLVLGLGMLVGLAPEITARVLGTAFGLATLVVAQRLVDELDDVTGEPRGGWSLVAPALLAFSAGFACWSSGGLETQMFTFWVSLSLYAYARAERAPHWLRWLGVFLALAAMTRPEGLLVTGLIGVHRLIANLVRERRIVPTRAELTCLGLFLAVWAPWYAWRWWYYGYPFPNTAYVKAGGAPPPGYTETLLSNGVYYVWQWAWQSKAVLAAPVILAGLVWARPGSRRLYLGSLALALAVVYLAYTVSVGGDFMGLHRFVMPMFVIAAVGCALGLRLLARWLAAWVPGMRRRPVLGAALGAALALAVIAAFAVDQVRLTAASTRWGNWTSDHGIDTPAYLRIYTADRAAIGAHMRPCFAPDDFSIVGGAGAQPYEGRMRAIDVFGLVSERIAHEVPPTNPRAGHNKWGPDSLLLEHEPDFVFSCYSIHSRPDNPRFNCNPGFWQRHGYERVTLRIPGLRQQGEYYSFWKRKERAFSCPGQVSPGAAGPR
jgi:arabinofuranosyltransferase